MLNWIDYRTLEDLPKTDKDLYIVIRCTDNTPFLYLSCIWDGERLWVYTNHDDAPFDTLNNVVKFDKYAIIE